MNNIPEGKELKEYAISYTYITRISPNVVGIDLTQYRDVYLQGLASYLFHQYYCLRVNRVYAEINTFLPPFSKRLFIAMIHRKV